MKTQVAIIGAGPAGSLLSHLLGRAGIDSVVVERQSRAYVLERIRAGVLEWGTVELLREAGLGQRMDAEGHVHETINIAWRGAELLSIDTVDRVGKQMMAYGQTQIQEDLYAAADASGAAIVFEADDVTLHDVTTDSPSVTYRHNGTEERIEADFIAGCDGFHGVSRQSDPGRCPDRVREGLPLRLGRDPVRDPAPAHPDVRQPRAGVRPCARCGPRC